MRIHILQDELQPFVPHEFKNVDEAFKAAYASFRNQRCVQKKILIQNVQNSDLNPQNSEVEILKK